MKQAFKITAMAAALGLAATAVTAEPLEIGLMVPSPLADTGWSKTLADGLDAVKEKYGDDVSIEIVENIQEGPDADRIMNKMVADGDKFLVLGSFGYMNSGLKLAQRNSDVTVLHASGFKTAPNLSPFAAQYFEGAYLMGMAAADLTETKKLGVVSAFAIPELISTINGFALGARSVDPEIEVNVIWINSWFDPAKAQDSARALISQGNDILFSNAQDTPSVVTVGEEEGVHVFNLNSTMKDYAPTKYMGVVKTDWAPLFLRSVEQHLNGTFEGTNEWLGMADDTVLVEDWSSDISPEMMARIEETEAAIHSGTFNVYSGPIVNQAGEEVIGEGEVLSDEQVLGMNWHVGGVVSPLPK
ncbi:BMP family ABC transporter substrate-binding protein [Qingshengfaniella alkalisoli]|uniref:BMP family ABC transporter substrate-binding protein n=1 Tax=Qingshengfaniella alkalisoli TaxID=2599296 RepID=A0A5B8IY42_9RHOB|nr:BMP family ABC transporter substrate-binding protein [Qingshengfaniella alkalisoli]QDY71072.1 BMP family ABC transporter substrate-binding protein [Qingshengfaniella alkalisoli]